MSVIIVSFLEDDGLQISAEGSSQAALLLRQKHVLDLTADGVSSAALDFDVLKILAKLKINASSIATVELVTATNIEISADGESSAACELRLNDEANIFLELSANGASGAAIEFVRSQAVVFVSRGSSNAVSNLSQIESPSAELSIFVRIVPDFQNAQTRKTGARFKINGAEVPIKQFTLNAPENSLGKRLDVTFSKPILSQIGAADDFTFELLDGGIWHNVFSGKLSSQNYRIAFAADSLVISSLDTLSDKLLTAPRRPTILYDPLKAEISVDESDILKDSDGNSYPTVFAARSGMKLLDALNFVYVEKCGFESVKTNIPNYKISRIDFGLEATFHQAIAGLVGMFEPVFFEQDGDLWILDTTQQLPEGFAPRDLNASRYKQLSRSFDGAAIDGFKLQFVAGTGEFSAVRVEPDEPVEIGSFGNDDYSQTTRSRTIREFFSFDAPTVVLGFQIEAEEETTRDNSLNIVGRKSSTATFDGFGNVISERFVTEARVPDLETTDGTRTLLTVRDEKVSYGYASINLRGAVQQVISSKITQVRGLIAIDAENQYFDADFRQDVSDADRSGNLASGMTANFGAIKTVIESLKALPNNQTKISVITIDHLRGSSSPSTSEVVAGSPRTEKFRNREIIVWASEEARTNSNRKLESLSVGELPLKFAKPLAKRKLSRIANRKGTAAADIPAFDLSIERGTVISIKGRGNAALGNGIVKGYTITGDFEAKTLNTNLSILEL